MDPSEAGAVAGRFLILGCCLIVGLAVIAGIVWAVIHFTRKPPPPSQPPL